MRLSRRLIQKSKFILAILLVCLVVRLLPYFAPIHAADIAQNRLALEFSDRNGLPLGTILTRDQEHTAVVPLNQVSPQFINAILAAEDSSFYHHGALDMKAIIRAINQAIHAKRILSGASTITMQLARMLEPTPRNLSGKLQEIWLAWRLAAGMNKNEILAAYINRLPMGGNIYGVEAASRTYFSIPASDVNLAQASLLAAIPNNPTYFDPLQHWDRLKQRQKYVLKRMVQDGYITQQIADKTQTEKVVFQSRQRGIIAAPHFLFWLASQIQIPPNPPYKGYGVYTSQITPLNPTPLATTEGTSATQWLPLERGETGTSSSLPLERGGLGWGNSKTSSDLITDRYIAASKRDHLIQTTIDRPLQQFIEAQAQQVISTLAANNVHDAAALVIDNHTGEVLAYVGSPDYFNEAKLGRNDGVQALRQPGSTLKPFVYELALEKKLIRPNTILADVPAHYAIPGAKLYSPTDYTQRFLGPVRVRIALANSLNVPAVRVLEKIGVPNFLARLRELGFTHLNQTPEYYGLGLTLGSGEVTLWELAQAYVTMARQGQAIPVLTTILNSPLPTFNSSNQTTWQIITDILSDHHARATAFGVDSVLNLPFPAAVKTGTSSNFRDTWTVGFTTDYTVATWVGNFNGEPMRQVSGVMGAAPLWNRIMLYLHEHQEPTDFAVSQSLIKLPICAISGLRPTPDCNSVVQEYFYPEDKIAYETQTNFDLPPEYDEWLAKQPSNYVSSKLRIVSPHNGDLFLLYPGTEGQQKLEFKLAGNQSTSVEWWLSGEKLDTQSTNLFWYLRPGNWTLEARSGETSDKVSFQVELAKIRPTRRGFSVMNSQTMLGK